MSLPYPRGSMHQEICYEIREGATLPPTRRAEVAAYFEANPGDIDIKGTDGLALLYYACVHWHLTYMKLLLEQGADVTLVTKTDSKIADHLIRFVSEEVNYDE